MMNLREALNEAVLGERVRATNMGDGVFIDYQFNGWRINFPSGASSGWHSRDIDEAAEWEVVSLPEPMPTIKVEPKPAWPDFKPSEVTQRMAAVMGATFEPKRRDRPRKAEPVQFTGSKVEWEKPAPKVASNPWAEAGLTNEVAWPILQGK